MLSVLNEEMRQLRGVVSGFRHGDGVPSESSERVYNSRDPDDRTPTDEVPVSHLLLMEK